MGRGAAQRGVLLLLLLLWQVTLGPPPCPCIRNGAIPGAEGAGGSDFWTCTGRRLGQVWLCLVLVRPRSLPCLGRSVRAWQPSETSPCPLGWEQLLLRTPGGRALPGPPWLPAESLPHPGQARGPGKGWPRPVSGVCGRPALSWGRNAPDHLSLGLASVISWMVPPMGSRLSPLFGGCPAIPPTGLHGQNPPSAWILRLSLGMFFFSGFYLSRKMQR